MNINPLIESALSGLTFGGKTVFYAPLVIPDNKKGKAYCTYYTYLEHDVVYADDEPQEAETFGTVDIFCKGDYKSLLQDVKGRLCSAGFIIGDVGPELYENDTGYYHVPVNIYMEG